MAENSNVEERIVAAKFDASDFEKGVNKTIKKLDELNEKLEFKKTGESVASFAKKTAEAQDKASSSIEKLTDRYTTFVGMLKQKLLSGLADQIVNVFFRMEKAALSFAKSMTFDQISAGLAKYESALTSVRMIVNSYKTVKNDITGLTEKIHYTQEEAYTAIGHLQTYADETSYSMEQMTDAMSKMVSAGVTLEQAERNVQGIANACAAAGVNAQDAARAFYNLSQAYSSGSLKYTDYRSLQLLNMTNENFEEQLIAAGIKAGTLEEKTDKKGNKIYKTKKSATNKKVTAGKTFTRSQAADALRYGWADTEVMDYLFGNKFFVDVEDFYAARASGGDITEYLKGLKDYDAIGAWVEKLDKNDDRRKAYEQVKNDSTQRQKFLDDLMKEADWVDKAAQKFGKIDDTALLKWIDSLAETDERKINYRKVMNNAKERRKYLDDLKKDADVAKNVKGASLGYSVEQLDRYIMSLSETDERRAKYEKMSAADKKKYLKQLVEEAQALGKLGNKYDEIAVKAFLAAREARNLTDVINAVKDFVSSKFTKVFENLIGKLDDASEFFTSLAEGGIASLFMDFAEWVANVSDSFNIGGAGSEVFRDTILELDEALGNLLGIFNLLLPDSDEFGRTMYEVSTSISIAMQEFNNWTAIVVNWIKDEENQGARLKRIQEIFANLSGIFAIVGRGAGLAFQTIGRTLHVLAPVLDATITALGKMTEPIGRLGSSTEPFDALSESLTNIFKILDPLAEKIQEPIVVIGEIIGIIGDFFIGGAIDTVIMNIKFFSDAFGLLLELIGVGSAQKDNGHGVLDGIKTDVTNLANACRGAITTITQFFGKLFDDLRILFGFKPTDPDAKKSGIFSNVQNFLDTNEFVKSAQAWLAQAKIDIQNWFDQAVKDVQTWFANLPETIGNAINDILYAKHDTKDGKKDTEESAEGVTSTLYDWLANIKTNLETWYEQAKTDIQTWFEELPGKISSFFAGFLYTTEVPTQDIEAKKTDVEGVYATPLKLWLDGVIDSVADFVAKIPEYLIQGIGKVFDVFGIITNLIFGDGEEDSGKKRSESEKLAGAATQEWANKIFAKIKEAIKNIPGQVTKLISETKGKFKESWAKIRTWFTDPANAKVMTDLGNSILSGIKTFIVKLPESIKNIIQNVGSIGRDIISTIKDVIGIGKIGDEVQTGMEDEFSKISLSSVLTSIADIGATIVNEFLSWFTGTNDIEHNVNWFTQEIVNFITSIPDKLWNAARKLGAGLGSVWNYVLKRLQSESESGETGDPTADQFAKEHPIISGWIDGLVAWIKGIPKQLEDAWHDALGGISRFWGGLSSYWQKLDTIQELEKISHTTGLTGSQRQYLELLKNTATDFEKNQPDISGFVSSIHGWVGGIENGFNNLWTGDFSTSIGEFFTNLPTTLSTSWESVRESVTTFFDEFIAFWNKPTGTADATDDANLTPTEFETKYPAIAGWITAFKNWLNSIPDTISGAFTTAARGVNVFFREFSTYWSKLDQLRNIEKALNDPKLSAKDRADLEGDRADILNNSTNFELKYPFVSSMIGSFHGWVFGIPDQLSTTWEEAKGSLQTFWSEFLTFITDPTLWSGESADTTGTETATDFEEKYPGITSLIKSIIAWVRNIPTELEQAWQEALTGINNFWSGLTGYWAKLDRINEIQNALNNMDFNDDRRYGLESELSALSNTKTDFERQNPMIAGLAGTLNGWLNDIPGLVSDGFTSSKTALTNFWDDLVKAFNGELISDKPDSEKSFGEKAYEGIVKFFADLPTHIANAINAALTGLSTAFSGLTDFINGSNLDTKIEGSLDTIADNAAKAMDAGTKDIVDSAKDSAEDAAKATDKDSPNSGFVEAIKNVGNTLWTIITKTIPDFIKSGFDFVGRTWSKDGGILDSINKIFEDVTGIKVADIDVSNLGKKLIEALNKLPSTIGKLWKGGEDFVRQIFGLKKPLPEDMAKLISEASPFGGPAKEALKASLDEAGYDITDTAEESGLFGAIGEIANNLKTALFKVLNETDIGAWILQGVTGGMNLLGKVMEALTKLFTGESKDVGDAVEDLADETLSDENKGLLKSVGDSILKFFTETIPAFLGSGIGFLLQKIPGMWNTFWNGVVTGFNTKAEDASEEIEQKAKAPEGAATTGIKEFLDNGLGFVEHIFNDITAGALGTGAAIIAGLVLLMKIVEMISNVINSFDVAGQRARRAEAVNSMDAVFKRMLTAMIAAMALVVYMSQLPEDKYQKASDVLTALKGLLETFAWFYGGSKILENGADLVNAFKGARDNVREANGSARELVKAGDIFATGMASATSTFAKGLAIEGVAYVGENVISDLIQNLIKDFTGVTGSIDIFSKMMPDAVEKIANMESNISTALTVMGHVLEMVGKMKEIGDRAEDVNAARLVIRKIRLSLGGLAAVFKGDFHADALYDGLTKIMGLLMSSTMTEFIDFIQKDNTFDLFKESIASLGAAMSLYDGVNLDSTITETGINNAIEILKSILGNDELMGLAKKLTPESFGVSSAEMLETSERVIIFSSAISRIGAAFKDFSGTTATGLQDFINAVQTLSVEDALAEGTSSGEAGLVSFAEKMAALGDGLSAFGAAIGDFEEKDVTNAGYALDMVAALAERLDDVGRSFLSKIFNGGTSLEQFSGQLSVLGTGLQTFMTAMHPIADKSGEIVDWNFDNIFTAMYAINKVAEAAKTLGGVLLAEAGGDIAKLTELLSTNNNIGGLISNFVQNLSIPSGTVDHTSVIKSVEAFSKLAESLKLLNGIDIKSVVDSITDSYDIQIYDGKIKHGWLNIRDNPLVKLIDYMFEIYTNITQKMNEVEIKIPDAKSGTAKVTLKTQIDKVKSFFGLLSEVFIAIGDIMRNRTYTQTSIDLGNNRTKTEFVYERKASEVISDLVSIMSLLQENITVFFSAIDTLSGYEDDDRLEKAKNVMGIIHDIVSIWMMFSSDSSLSTDYADPFEGLYALNGVDEEVAKSGIEKMLRIIGELSKNEEVLNSINTAGFNVAQSLAEGIQAAFNSEDEVYHPKISVVLDEGSVKTQMAELFGLDSSVDFNISSGFAEAVKQAFGGSETFTSLAADVSSIKTVLDENISYINQNVAALNGEMTAVKDTFASMGVRLDTDVLVGALTPGITAEQDRMAEWHINRVTTVGGVVVYDR